MRRLSHVSRCCTKTKFAVPSAYTNNGSLSDGMMMRSVRSCSGVLCIAGNLSRVELFDGCFYANKVM